MVKAIPLTQGKFALVDDEDFARVAEFKWTARRSEQGPENWYAQRTVCPKGAPRYTVQMHRFILGVTGRIEVDHRDHDGLNNQRHNLRSASRTQNQINVRTKGGADGFRGVEFRREKGDFRAAVTVAKRKNYAGVFASAEAAARAYDELALRLHGEFACLNFPDEGR